MAFPNIQDLIRKALESQRVQFPAPTSSSNYIPQEWRAPATTSGTTRQTADTLERRRRRIGNEQSTDYKAWLARNTAYAPYPPTQSAIPNEPFDIRPRQIGTPNQTIINLERAREEIENRPHGQSIGLTSYDLDPALAGRDPNTLAALEAEIRALANQEDIPGQWISPYSQEYLNQLGSRLGQAGSEAQAQFQAAIGDIVENYGAGMNQVSGANAALANELGANAGNIGVNYGASQQGQQMANDVAYLNQVAGTNQATDTSFMTKMGELAQFYGGNLAAQAREGLLTPKQWVGPQSGISAGEGLLADFLTNKYNRALDREELERKLAADVAASRLKDSSIAPGAPGGVPLITTTAEEGQSIRNPEFLQALGTANLSPSQLDLIQQLYNESEGSVTGALAKAQERMRESAAAGPVYPDSPIFGQRAGTPIPRTGLIPRGGSGPAGALNLAEVYTRAKDYESENWRKIIEFLMKYSPAWNPVSSGQEIKTSSSQKTAAYS